MGILDLSSAKQQFFTLVDAISASHLPSFTIWLDAKLAEYKTIGQLKPDTEYESREQYPEWIGKALRQNLSFLLLGRTQTSSSSENIVSQTVGASTRKRRQSGASDTGSGEKRSKITSYGTDLNEAIVPEEELVMVVKEEPGGSETFDVHYLRAADTPLPGIQSTFSLAGDSDFALRPPASFPFSTASKSNVTCSATSVTSSYQPSYDSMHRSTFSDNTEDRKYSCPDTRMSAGTSERESLPLFSPSVFATKVESYPDLPACSPGEPSACSVTLPISAAPPVIEPVETRRPSQAFSEEAVQALGDDKLQVVEDGATATRQPHARKGRISGQRRHGSTVCGVKCRDASTLKAHHRTHTSRTGERPYTCSECGAQFTFQSALKEHQRRHTGNRPYNCRECDSGFCSAGDLKRHMRTHNGERPHSCSECPATFARRDTLRIHKRTHTGERPFTCSQCPAKFAQRCILTKHERIHTGDRPHACSKCSATFSRISGLNVHLRSHKGE